MNEVKDMELKFELIIKNPTRDMRFTFKVKSKIYDTSPESEKAVSLNMFGSKVIILYT